MKPIQPDPNAKTVYSTGRGPEAPEERAASSPQAAAPAGQVLKLRLERKGRGGKVVTIVAGVSGRAAAADDLARMLKTLCGAGGTVKREGATSEIEIQGDHRPKVAARLREMGFTVKGA